MSQLIHLPRHIRRLKRTFEPLVRINHPPDHHRQHRRPPHKARPVHQTRGEIASSNSRQTQNGNHERRKARRQRSNHWAVLAQMPRTLAEPVADEKGSNGDWDCESDERGNGGNTEDGANRDHAAEDEERQADTNDSVEPHSVDWSLRVLVDPLPDAGEREAVVTGVRVCDPTSSHHAALTHAKATDDGDAEDGESGLLRHDLKEVGSPWLAERGVDDGGDVNDSVRGDELQEPPEKPAETRGHNDGAWRGDVGVAAFL